MNKPLSEASRFVFLLGMASLNACVVRNVAEDPDCCTALGGKASHAGAAGTSHLSGYAGYASTPMSAAGNGGASGNWLTAGRAGSAGAFNHAGSPPNGNAGSAGTEQSMAGSAGRAGQRLGYCLPCQEASDCAGESAICLEIAGQKSCVPNCDVSNCPESGQHCVLTDDGHNYCLPLSNDCACTAPTNGLMRACSVQNTLGTCTGAATCDSTKGFVNCSARTPTAEVCNAVDDDCDGTIDEDFPDLGAACDGPDRDRCANGRVLCAAGGAGVTCSSETVTDLVELCDDLDNDCDGETDEGCDSDRDGYCDAAMQMAGAPAVCANGGNDCNDEDPAVHPAAPELCDGIDNDCSNRVDDVATAPPNENQSGACAGTTQACVDAHWINDYHSVTGFGLADSPDDTYADTNCDGIDGTLGAGVFVSLSGLDLGGCSKDFPCKTLAYGQSVAVHEARPQIYVAAGIYEGVLELTNGIEIYGGYDTKWVRGSYSDPEHRVTLSGGTHNAEHLAVYASNVTAKLADLVILAPDVSDVDAAGNGRSSYGAYITHSTVTFERVGFFGGKGANGLAGKDGTGTPATYWIPIGTTGGDGNSTVALCDDTTRGASGPGATNPNCDTPTTKGGDGGAGGLKDGDCSGFNATDGLAGGDGNSGAKGGSGGTKCGAGRSGSDGSVGVHGIAGRQSQTRGKLRDDFWYTLGGGNGALGEHGNGGGGGGGGAGCDNGFLVPDGAGAGGGGGGAGGCRALSAGTGGAGGGSSFGLFALSSSLTVTNSEFRIGIAGIGGPGGNGARGQTGSPGGPGGKGSSSGAGGNGGNGGNGGGSGGGAGGNGGIAYGIFLLDSTNSTNAIHGCTFSPGTAGFGGTGGSMVDGTSGQNGRDGATGEVFDCAVEDEC